MQTPSQIESRSEQVRFIARFDTAGFGKLASLDIPEDGIIDMAEAAAKYNSMFEIMLWIGVGSDILYFVLSPMIHKMMYKPTE